MSWLEAVRDVVEREGAVARAVIIATTGPTPRAVGTAMILSRGTARGRLGRGAVDAAARQAASRLLDAVLSIPGAAPAPLWLRERLSVETGDVMGAASGGTITLLVEAFGKAELAALDEFCRDVPRHAFFMREVATGAAPLLTTRLSELSASWPAALSLVGTPSGEAVVEPLQPVGPPFYVYGSGLTARALVRMLADLPFATTWLDRAPINFPPTPLPGISTWCGDLVEAVRQVRVGAFHAVMTSDHDLDLAVASAILQRGDFAYLGVIGSRLKRERLLRALAGDGVPERLLSRIDCPIGLPSIRSKNPAVVAVAVVAQALSLSANTAPGEADHATGTNR